MNTFSDNLENLIEASAFKAGRNATDIRPFVCDGSPLQCNTFLIGTNPASTVSWHQFWDAEAVTFDKWSWFESYKSERMVKKIAQGKNNAREVSPTRKRIDLFVTEAASLRILETNVFSISTPSEKDLRLTDRRPEIFEFLLQTIKPGVMFVHGGVAISFLKNRYGIDYAVHGEIKKVRMPYGEALLLGIPHLSPRNSSVTNEKITNWARLLCKQSASSEQS